MTKNPGVLCRAQPRRLSTLSAPKAYAIVAILGHLCVRVPMAHAERGELETRVSSGHELVFLRYPSAAGTRGVGAAGYLPRFGAHLGFGVTHALSLGISPSASLPRDISLQVQNYQDVREGRLVSTYHDIVLPAVAELSFAHGTAWSWGVCAAAGLALAHWNDVYMTKPTAEGVVLDVPIVPQSSWQALGFFELGVYRAFRPSDTFGLRLGASVGVKHQGDIHLGLTLSGEGLFGVGR